MKPKGTATFPSSLVSREEAGSKKYIRSYLKAMYQQWKGVSSDYDSSAKRRRFQENRLYGEGSQDVAKYKNLINPSGDTSSLNLDWSIVPIIPKFVDVIANGILNKEYEIKATAIDPVSISQFQRKKAELWADMVTKDAQDAMSMILGIKPKREEYIPEDSEELSLYMDADFKQIQEISIEQGIEFVLKLNSYEDLRKKIVRDLVVVGTGAAKVYIDPVHGVKLRYVDPSNLITSHSKYDDYRNCQHFGEVYNITISELKKICNDDLSEEDYQDIAEKYLGKNGNPSTFDKNTFLKDSDAGEFDYDSFSVTVMDGEFILSNKLTYEKKSNRHGGYSFHKKKSGYKKPKKSKFKRDQVDTVVNFLYNGIYVVDTDIVINYGESKNQIRPKSSLFEVKSSYVIYTPNLMSMSSKSLVDRMKPFADQIQLTHLKLQQLVAKARPKGVAFELGALEDVSKGDGGTFTPLELQDIYDQTGNIYYRRKDEEGVASNAFPITELENGIGNDMVKLVNIYNYNMQMIRDVTGINEARDGMQPDKDALVGTQKLAIQASNNATRHIDESEKNITKRLGTCITLAIQDMVSYNKPFKGYAKSIGKNMISFEITKDMSIHEFSIFLETEPDEEQKFMLEQNIQASIASKELRIEDAISIRRMKNVKLANRMLILRRKRYLKEQQEQAQQQMQQQAQIEQQKLMMQAEADAKRIQIETQSKAQLEQAKAQAEISKMEQEYKLKADMAKKQFEYDYTIAKLKEGLSTQRDSDKEDRKDSRVKKQAAEQSKLLSQRMGERGEFGSEQPQSPIDQSGAAIAQGMQGGMSNAMPPMGGGAPMGGGGPMQGGGPMGAGGPMGQPMEQPPSQGGQSGEMMPPQQ
jgi:hypothetical protein